MLFDAAETVRSFGVLTEAELQRFAGEWARMAEVEEDRRHALLSTATQGAYDAARALDDEPQSELRDALTRFTRFYGFLSQALPYTPPEAELLHQFAKVLLKRLQSTRADGGVDLSGQVVLTHYRLSELTRDELSLTGEHNPLAAIGGDGTGSGAPGEIPMSLLGELVELFNDRYGAELGDTDALKVVSDVRDSVRDANPALADQAQANSREDFVRERDALLIDAALSVDGDRDRQAQLLKALLDDDDFRARAGELVFGSIYDGYRQGSGA